jgi:molybdenum cofactor biosynthesis protein B
VRHAHHREAAGVKARVALLTVSDTRDAQSDTSGRTARERLETAGHEVVHYRILPDEPDRVRDQVVEWLGLEDLDAVILNGGTGISRRDRTYEAISGLMEKKLDGFGELFRALSYREIASAAMMSRAVGGIARGKAIFSMPGSTAAVELALEQLILPELGHLVSELRKGGSAPGG